ISFLCMELDSGSMIAHLTNEHTQHKMAGPGAYVSLSLSYATRLAPYETASALATQPDPEMGMVPWHTPGRRYPGVPCVPTGKFALSPVVEARGTEYRCLQDRLGTLTAVAHQLPRFASSASPMLQDRHLLFRTDNIAM
ncbi:hypothetical protein M9458_042900, partial [Cirrhinus mrigala]